MPYRPGTINPVNVVRHTMSRRNRHTKEANTPNGSSIYQTTNKVKAFEGDLSDVDEKATQAQQTAQQAQSTATEAQSTASQAAQQATANQQSIKTLEDRTGSIEATLTDHGTALDALADRDGAVESTLAASTIVATEATGTAMPAIGATWTTLATLTIPERDGMTDALAAVCVAGEVHGGPSPVRVRLSVAGETMAEAPAPWAGGTAAYPGSRIGVHAVSITGMAECAPGDEIAVEAMAGQAGDYPANDDNAVRVMARVDYRREVA